MTLLRDDVDAGFVASWLYALLPVHRALEEALECSDDPRIRALFAPHHRRVEAFAADLRRLGHAPGSTERPACVDRYAASFAELDAATLAGRWYVFEGATNGGRMLAARIGRALDPERPVRLESVDPHGSRQGERWRRFREGLERFLDEAERCVAGAHDAFAFHAELFDARGVRGTGARP